MGKSKTLSIIWQTNSECKQKNSLYEIMNIRSLKDRMKILNNDSLWLTLSGEFAFLESCPTYLLEGFSLHRLYFIGNH